MTEIAHIQLPHSQWVRWEEKGGQPSPPTASVWFPSSVERRVWQRALGGPRAECLLLQSGSFQVLLKCFTGISTLSQLPVDGPRIIYLSGETLSNGRVNANLLKRLPQAVEHYSLSFFQESELTLVPGESSSPLQERYSMGKSMFGKTPFLTLDHQKAYPAFRRWLAELVTYTYLNALKGFIHTRRESTSHRALTLLKQASLERVENLEHLQALLLLCEEGPLLLQDLHAYTHTLNQLEKILQSLQEKLHELALESGNRTSENLKQGALDDTLGNELLPGLIPVRRKIREFASRLRKSEFDKLQTIGVTLPALLASRAPILALTGIYSSGKTTLLNNLLLSNADSRVRAFRTRPGANTAIVTEISQARAGEKEHVTFDYRSAITDFPLATLTAHGYQLSHIEAEYIHAIHDMLRKQVLQNPELTIVLKQSWGKYKPKDSFKMCDPQIIETFLAQLGQMRSAHSSGTPPRTADDLHSPVPISRSPSFIQDHTHEQSTPVFLASKDIPKGTYGFSAERIDSALLDDLYIKPELLPPYEIDLSNDAGWERFQGKPEVPRSIQQLGGKVQRSQKSPIHWTESQVATLVIKQAKVSLRHNLLELTTIADLPGTDSNNSGHDYVTSHYLQSAEAYLLLLPTKRKESKETILAELSNVFKHRPGGLEKELQSIAFVVNYWATTDENEEETKRTIYDYEKKLWSVFEMTESAWNRYQRNPQMCNFFVVQLKGLQTGERRNTLFDKPSFVPLRAWIERTLRSRKYRERYNPLLYALGEGWQQSKQNLVENKNNLDRDEQAKKNRCEKLMKLQEELADLADDMRERIIGFRKTFTGLAANVSELMELQNEIVKGIKKNQGQREHLEQWKSGLIEQYKELNSCLGIFASQEIIEEWVEEVRQRAKPLALDLPAFLFPDSPSSENAWSSHRFFNEERVKLTFREVLESWPDGFAQFFEKLQFWEHPDSRQVQLNKLQTFWKEEYADIWSQRLETYLATFLKFIEQEQSKIDKNIAIALERDKSSKNPVERVRQKIEIQATIDAFDQYEDERLAILRELQDIL